MANSWHSLSEGARKFDVSSPTGDSRTTKSNAVGSACRTSRQPKKPALRLHTTWGRWGVLHASRFCPRRARQVASERTRRAPRDTVPRAVHVRGGTRILAAGGIMEGFRRIQEDSSRGGESKGRFVFYLRHSRTVHFLLSRRVQRFRRCGGMFSANTSALPSKERVGQWRRISSSPHLHIMVRNGREALDPSAYPKREF